MITEIALMSTYKDYPCCLLANSEWLRLYRSEDEYITVLSPETGAENAISMDLFNEIGDYFMNTPRGCLLESEVRAVFKREEASANNILSPPPKLQ